MSEPLLAIILSTLALLGTIIREWVLYINKDKETVVQRQTAFEESVNMQEEKMRKDLFEKYNHCEEVSKQLKLELIEWEKRFREWSRQADRRMDRMETYIRKQPDGEAVLHELPPRPNGEYERRG